MHEPPVHEHADGRGSHAGGRDSEGVLGAATEVPHRTYQNPLQKCHMCMLLVPTPPLFLDMLSDADASTAVTIACNADPVPARRLRHCQRCSYAALSMHDAIGHH